jgi:putative glutathione S-transferase
MDPNRFLLVVSFTCPFARRTLLARALLGLKDLDVHYTLPMRIEDKWAFGDQVIGSSGSFLLEPSLKFLAEVYQKFPLNNWDKVNSVPYLIDKETKQGVSNSSGDIVSFMRNSLQLPPNAVVFRDESKVDLRALSSFVRCSFEAKKARNQQEWDRNIAEIDASLEKSEEILSRQPFLQGEYLSKDDVLLWPFLMHWEVSLQFTASYYKSLGTHFPCIFEYIKRIDALFPDSQMLHSVYNQTHTDLARKDDHSTILFKQPAFPFAPRRV